MLFHSIQRSTISVREKLFLFFKISFGLYMHNHNDNYLMSEHDRYCCQIIIVIIYQA